MKRTKKEALEEIKRVVRSKEAMLKCFLCDTPMKSVEDSMTKTVTGYVYAYDCDCIDNKNLRVLVG